MYVTLGRNVAALQAYTRRQLSGDSPVRRPTAYYGRVTGKDVVPCRLHVLYVVPHYSHKVDEVVVSSRDATISICTFFPPTIEPDVDVQLFPGDGTLLGFLRALSRAHRSDCYHVVHAHSPHVAFLLLIYRLSSGRSMKGSVFTAHHSFSNENLRLRHKLLDLFAFIGFQRIVCVGDSAFKSFPRLYRRLGGDRVKVIHNSVDLQRINSARGQLSEASESQESQFTFVYVGRLIPIKNPQMVLRAFEASSRNGSERLLLIGEGRLSDRLYEEIRLRGLGDVVSLTGLLPREKVYEVLHGADVFLSASLGEGLPVAVLQAMACRCAVVLSDIPPHQEVAHGSSFIPLIPPGDIQQFTEMMDFFRSLSIGERKDIGRRCRQIVEKRFTRLRAVRAHLTMYREILE